MFCVVLHTKFDKSAVCVKKLKRNKQLYCYFCGDLSKIPNFKVPLSRENFNTEVERIYLVYLKIEFGKYTEKNNGVKLSYKITLKYYK